MRILFLTDKTDIESKINSKLEKISKFLNIDIVHGDIGEAEYLLDIRRYNLIFLDFQEKHYKEFYNLFKVLKSYNEDFSYTLYINFPENVNKNIKETFITHTQKIYKNPNIKFLENQNEEFFFQKIEDSFYKKPDIIERYEIDIDQRIVTLIINNQEFEIKLKSKKDFKVLLFFIQHYGEILNIDTIISATFKDPEIASSSPIETAISSVREVFKKITENNPIVSHKRKGYRFAL